MEKNTVLVGNNMAHLAEMADNSVDAIVTDPPYGLSFMGKKWDYDVPSVEIWRECFRVLKPGGHLLAFAGTRTQHRMAVNIEDAGFEIRDMIAWVYGCLSCDTEILTKNGWEQYRKHRKDSIFTEKEILIYDTQKGEYKWEVPEKWNEYNVQSDTAYRIKSDKTDQIVSRGHRCLVERNGALVFVEADLLKSRENIPFLEGVPNMQRAVYGAHKGAGNQEQVLFKGLCSSPYFKIENRQSATNDGKAGHGNGSLFGLPKRGMEAKELAKKDKKPYLLQTMQWGFARTRLESPRMEGATIINAGKTDCICIEGRQKSGMEGGPNIFQTKWEIREPANKIHPLSEGVYMYGEERWLCYGAQVNSGGSNRTTLNKGGVCTPYQPRRDRQPIRKPNAVQEQCRTQEIRARAGYKTTLATVTAINYTGLIFCPTVSTGAFVARRNGKIFLTGNSGFPKSLDISKALDKMAGAEREVVGVKPGHESFVNNKSHSLNSGWDRPWASDPEKVKAYHSLTAPATDAAKQWQGWGTALKPSLEPITVARKPLTGTVAENVLQWGTGGINVDGCRVPTDELITNHSRGEDSAKSKGKYGDSSSQVTHQTEGKKIGRFPANLIHDGSEEVVRLFPDSDGQKGNLVGHNKQRKSGNGIFGTFPPAKDAIKRDETERSAARFFYTAKASASERGKDNTHPTVKPLALMRYLVRLVTPPGGLVYDPFAGSGTTIIAAILEGFEAVGSEMETEYAEIANKRIKNECGLFINL